MSLYISIYSRVVVMTVVDLLKDLSASIMILYAYQCDVTKQYIPREIVNFGFNESDIYNYV